MVKYTCDLVQDLYPLYEAGDLSPSVKKKVEEHLAECESCRSVFTTGKGFEDNKQYAVTESDDTLDSLDQRIRLAMKLRRMKILLGVLLSAVLILGINLYQNQRHQVASAYHDVYRGANELTGIIQATQRTSTEELGFLKNMFFDSFYNGNERLTRSLNWFEEQKLKDGSIYVDQQYFYATLDKLSLRKADNRWDEVDERTFKLLMKYAGEYMDEVMEDYENFNGGTRSFFATVDIEELRQPLEKINELTYTYNRFHKFPEQVQPLADDELRKRIAAIFGVNHEQVDLQKGLDHTNRFVIKNKRINGEVDSYSGYPINMDSYGDPQLTGELLDVDEVQGKAEELLGDIYGKEQEFSVVYLGINVDYSSNINDQLYTFSFKPKFDSLNYYAFSNQYNKMYFDARSGEFRMMQTVSSIPFTLDYNVSENNVISPEEGLHVLKKKVEVEDKALVEKRKYEFVDTFVIYSATSGGLVAVHAYAQNEQEHTWRFINIENGKEETLYFEY